MRKLVLIAAFVLASVAAAEAGQSRSLVLAAHETPAPAESASPQTAQAPQAEVQSAQPRAAPAETAKPQAAKPVRKGYARRQESDEAKARRIAARYGVYW